MKITKLTVLIFVLICPAIVILTSLFHKKKLDFSNELRGVLNITGSSSTQEICDDLAKNFMNNNRKVEIIKSGAGSAQAAISVLNGTAQIGDLSRRLNPDEKPEMFKAHIIALDGIAVCVNLKNKIKNLTSTQLHDIFTGNIKNWSEVGGINAPIVVVGRDEASGTRLNFEKFIDAKNRCAYLIEQESNGKIKEKIKNEENAIGYLSFSSVDSSINAIDIDGVNPSLENITNFSYKLYQPFIQITKKNLNDDLINAWFAFIFSNGSKEIFKKHHLIPVNKN